MLYFIEAIKFSAMKVSIISSILSLYLMLISINAFPQNAGKDGYIQLPGHPRILLLKGEEDGIRNTIASDRIWRKIDNFIITESDKMLAEPPVERILTGKRLLDKSREALRRIYFLSYSWRMTSGRKYLERAEKEMLAVSSFTDWNPSHFLDVAEMTMAEAIGYDWLYNDLPADSKNKIRDAIIEKGLKPSLLPANSSFVKDSHNWNQVCNAGMTYGALAVFEDAPELARSLIERAKESILIPMKNYGPDGAYPEGYNYWGYGTTFNVMFLSAMEKAFGKGPELADYKDFYKTAAYLENMTGPAGHCFNYSDSGSEGSMTPAMFWFANRLNDPSLLWSERFFLENRSLSKDRLLPSVMVWGSGTTMDKITPPEKTVWTGMGETPVALMRTSWTDPNAIYVAAKGGSPSTNHAHMDIGSFIMDAAGERWIMDFGMQDYNSLETKGVDLWNKSQNSTRWEVFRYNNFVHNTLTVNGNHQLVNNFGPITKYSDDPLMMNAVIDISSLYSNDLRKAVRGIAVVERKYVMVRDEVENSGSESVIRWNLLTSANVVVIGKDRAEFTKNGKRLVMIVKSPANITMKTWTTVPTHDYDAKNPGTSMVGFEVKLPADAKETLSVLLLPEGAEEDVEVTGKSLNEWPFTNNK